MRPGCYISIATLILVWLYLVTKMSVYPEGHSDGYRVVYWIVDRKRSGDVDCLTFYRTDHDCKPGGLLYECCHKLYCSRIAEMEGYSFEVL